MILFIIFSADVKYFTTLERVGWFGPNCIVEGLWSFKVIKFRKWAKNRHIVNQYWIMTPISHLGYTWNNYGARKKFRFFPDNLFFSRPEEWIERLRRGFGRIQSKMNREIKIINLCKQGFNWILTRIPPMTARCVYLWRGKTADTWVFGVKLSNRKYLIYPFDTTIFRLTVNRSPVTFIKFWHLSYVSIYEQFSIYYPIV